MGRTAAVSGAELAMGFSGGLFLAKLFIWWAHVRSDLNDADRYDAVEFLVLLAILGTAWTFHAGIM